MSRSRGETTVTTEKSNRQPVNSGETVGMVVLPQRRAESLARI